MLEYPGLLNYAVIPIAMLAGDAAGHLLAVASTVPDWATPIFGSAGALAFAVYALRWMAGQRESLQNRIDTREAVVDAREIERHKERDRHLQTISEMTIRTTNVIEQNSAILQDTRFAIEKCMKCEVKHLIGKTPPSN